MKTKPIKLFLGGYINNTNAQNLNCLALAKHLDKTKFKIYALEVYSGNLESQKGKLKNVTVFNCFKPFKISQHLGYLWGIWHCDIAYLPKREINTWTSFWIKVLNKKSFSTIEGIYDAENLKSALEHHGSYENWIKGINSFDTLYSITKFLKDYNEQHHKVVTETKPLYLGCEIEGFLNTKQRTGQLNTIVYIGRLKKRKGIYDIVQLTKVYPEINFLVYGNGEEEQKLQEIIENDKLVNFKLKGVITHTELAEILKSVDLHILPSRSEGFPKVTLETAAAGVPSLVYGDYGASEWITHNHNGFVVDTLEQMIEILKQLKENPELLQFNSRNAVALAKRFDWVVLIKEWEQEILKLYHS